MERSKHPPESNVVDVFDLAFLKAVVSPRTNVGASVLVNVSGSLAKPIEVPGIGSEVGGIGSLDEFANLLAEQRFTSVAVHDPPSAFAFGFPFGAISVFT